LLAGTHIIPLNHGFEALSFDGPSPRLKALDRRVLAVSDIELVLMDWAGTVTVPMSQMMKDAIAFLGWSDEEVGQALGALAEYFTSDDSIVHRAERGEVEDSELLAWLDSQYPGASALFDVDQPLIEFLRSRGKEDQLSALEFERNNIEYAYTRQREQLGLGDAVLCAEPFVRNEPFIVALGDSIIGVHGRSQVVKQMVDVCEDQQAEVVVAFEELESENEVVHYGIAKPGKSLGGGLFKLDDVVEKPTPAEAPSRLAVAARYVFQPSIFEYLRNTGRGKGGEIQLTDAMRSLLADRPGSGVGLKLPAGEGRYDIGNFESYFDAFVDFALADDEYGAGLRKRLQDKLKS